MATQAKIQYAYALNPNTGQPAYVYASTGGLNGPGLQPISLTEAQNAVRNGLAFHPNVATSPGVAMTTDELFAATPDTPSGMIDTYVNPTTGEVLHNVPQSVIDNLSKIPSNLGGSAPAVPAPNLGGASNGTSSTSTTGSASSDIKPFGIENITKTLNFGSQGTDVKELQNYLAGLGYTGADGKPLKADGIYGNETKTAVMQFQQHNGLTQDGVFGPKSLAATKNITSTSQQAGSAPTSTPVPTPTSTPTPDTSTPPATKFNTGDPTQDALLSELQNYIKTQQDAGLKINGALNFDQATIDKFLETAKNQVHPYYASQIDAVKQSVLHDAPQVLQNYGNDVATKESNFQNDLGTARENYAGNGLAFSGARGKAELGMLDSQNRDLASLNQQYGNKLYDLGTNAGAKIGDANVPSLGSLSNYSANLNGNGSFDSTGSNTPYTPGNQIGSLNYDEQAAIEARNQALKKTASESVVAGRGYQDLFA